MKIVEKVKAAYAEDRTIFSFEYFPPKTQEGVENLFDRMDRMAAQQPAFCDITWGAGGSTADLTLDIATKMQNMVCVETSMHLTCTNMPAERIDSALEKVKTAGIQNILALRGDPPHGQEKFVQTEGGFSCALDLVKHIRSTHGDYFGLAVAGYPEAHPDAISTDGATNEEYEKDLKYLKEKVDAGGELIITQLFYDVDIFLKFVTDCRRLGIDVPIVPGIMPIGNYNGFKRMTGFCKTKVPAHILGALEPIKENDEAVKAYGIHLGIQMCRRLIDSGVRTLHLYTLNLEKSSLSILQGLGLIDGTSMPRSLPWRQSANIRRSLENVRPIHWANRPRSYISRTTDWDQFPKGRWGDSRSPAYGDLSDYQFLRRRSRSSKLQEEWGANIGSVEDVQKLFADYCAGRLTTCPWSELEGLQPETEMINERLVAINLKGFLTINSQPPVNGEPSSSPAVGWGGPGGYVYQKAYVEFFCSLEQLQAMISKAKDFPSLTYMAVNATGDVKSNVGPRSVNAVTWGVFPAKEVVQPSVVDPVSFLVWKEEAFGVWQAEWGQLFPEDSPSKKLLTEIHDTFYLVSIVDNDYIRGDLFAIFQDL
eukprot:SM000034S12806  [mRNA]  locus=s34:894582:899292:- [translate_table: standard]